MGELAVLLGIPLRGAFNTLRRSRDFPWIRGLFFLFVGLILLSTVYGLLLLVFRYFFHQPVIGPFLVSRMFSLAFLTFLFMLVYSNVMTSLSSHYLSRDLPLLLATPARPARVFLAKAGEALIGSSWMVVLMCIPLYAAFGRMKHIGPDFYWHAMLATIPFLLIPAAFSMALTTGMMFLFPARRMREAMVLLGTVMFTGVVVAFRLMEPEKLVNPSDSTQVFEFMKQLAAPSAPYLPSAWAGTAVIAASNINHDPWGFWTNTLLLWAVAAVAWAACLLLASRMYLPAWRTSNESMGVRRSVRLAARWLPRKAGPYAAILLKDLKIFIREPAQWGQMLLLAALILIYVFNLSRIPRDVATGLKSLLFFLNLGFIGLILTAVAARFLFPMVSLEGGTMALVKRAPISFDKYLWVRFLGGIVPLGALALALVVFSVPILQVDAYMAVVAFFTIMGITLAVSGLAVGCGAIFAKFHISNPEEIVTSTGGFVYMGLSMVYITAVLVLEAQPVRLYYWAKMFRRAFQEQTLTIAAFAGAALMTALAIYIPIKLGARALERREL